MIINAMKCHNKLPHHSFYSRDITHTQEQRLITQDIGLVSFPFFLSLHTLIYLIKLNMSPKKVLLLLAGLSDSSVAVLCSCRGNPCLPGGCRGLFCSC